MNRYLTPSKIGLLILIELYVESNVPNSTIPIVSFILNQLLSHSPKPQSPESISHWQYFSHPLSFTLDLESFELLLAPHPTSSNFQCTTLWDYFLKKIWDIDSLDALHDFFSHRTSLLVKTREEIKKSNELGIPLPSDDKILLSRTSPFGSFIRKSSIEFERLKFNESVALWTAFNIWRHSYNPTQPKKTDKTSAPAWIGDVALNYQDKYSGKNSGEKLELFHTSMGSQDIAGCRISTDDVGKLLEFQVEKMQKFQCKL